MDALAETLRQAHAAVSLAQRDLLTFSRAKDCAPRDSAAFLLISAAQSRQARALRLFDEIAQRCSEADAVKKAMRRYFNAQRAALCSAPRDISRSRDLSLCSRVLLLRLRDRMRLSFFCRWRLAAAARRAETEKSQSEKSQSERVQSAEALALFARRAIGEISRNFSERRAALLRRSEEIEKNEKNAKNEAAAFAELAARWANGAAHSANGAARKKTAAAQNAAKCFAAAAARQSRIWCEENEKALRGAEREVRKLRNECEAQRKISAIDEQRKISAIDAQRRRTKSAARFGDFVQKEKRAAAAFGAWRIFAQNRQMQFAQNECARLKERGARSAIMCEEANDRQRVLHAHFLTAQRMAMAKTFIATEQTQRALLCSNEIQKRAALALCAGRALFAQQRTESDARLRTFSYLFVWHCARRAMCRWRAFAERQRAERRHSRVIVWFCRAVEFVHAAHKDKTDLFAAACASHTAEEKRMCRKQHAAHMRYTEGLTERALDFFSRTAAAWILARCDCFVSETNVARTFRGRTASASDRNVYAEGLRAHSTSRDGEHNSVGERVDSLPASLCMYGKRGSLACFDCSETTEEAVPLILEERAELAERAREMIDAMRFTAAEALELQRQKHEKEVAELLSYQQFLERKIIGKKYVDAETQTSENEDTNPSVEELMAYQRFLEQKIAAGHRIHSGTERNLLDYNDVRDEVWFHPLRAELEETPQQKKKPKDARKITPKAAACAAADIFRERDENQKSFAAALAEAARQYECVLRAFARDVEARRAAFLSERAIAGARSLGIAGSFCAAREERKDKRKDFAEAKVCELIQQLNCVSGEACDAQSPGEFAAVLVQVKVLLETIDCNNANTEMERQCLMEEIDTLRQQMLYKEEQFQRIVAEMRERCACDIFDVWTEAQRPHAEAKTSRLSLEASVRSVSELQREIAAAETEESVAACMRISQCVLFLVIQWFSGAADLLNKKLDALLLALSTSASAEGFGGSAKERIDAKAAALIAPCAEKRHNWWDGDRDDLLLHHATPISTVGDASFSLVTPPRQVMGMNDVAQSMERYSQVVDGQLCRSDSRLQQFDLLVMDVDDLIERGRAVGRLGKDILGKSPER